MMPQRMLGSIEFVLISPGMMLCRAFKTTVNIPKVCKECAEREGRGGIRRRRQKGRGRKEGGRVIEESSFSSCLQSSRSSLHYLSASFASIHPTSFSFSFHHHLSNSHPEAPEESEGGQQREYWTPRNMRAYMESYARSRNLDPLLPETWYSSFTGFSHSRVCQLKYE